MAFLRVWLTGYYNPIALAQQLRSKPAPHWGLFAQLLRAGMDSLLVYLPLALMGRVPPTPSFLPFLPTQTYYSSLIWLGPIVLMAELLLSAVILHVVLRLLGRHSDVDQIINIGGMSALVVGAVLVPWDWTWFALGVADQYFLGISHLVIALWSMVIMIVGLRRILCVPTGLSIALGILTFPVGMPLAIMFMRSPV